MLDLGWAELLLVAVVALIVVGPKDLPTALRTVTGYVRQARAMAREFQRGIEDIAKDSGIQDIKRELQDSVGLGLDDDIKKALTVDLDDDEPKKVAGKTVDPTTGGNSIMDPAIAKMAAKPNSAPADDDAGPQETPKP
ncbi:MAG: Sec-independent protein translocase protein TatB, partial [Alphaproteobacteria bacterium]